MLHRARIVGRFLDFLAHEGSIASNPVADLRAEHSVNRADRSCERCSRRTRIRRWKKLRQLPPFGSVAWRSDARSHRVDA